MTHIEEDVLPGDPEGAGVSPEPCLPEDDPVDAPPWRPVSAVLVGEGVYFMPGLHHSAG